ncbi:MAG: hypothetical protein AAGD11_12110 [Planctomycetota bacterium]
MARKRRVFSGACKAKVDLAAARGDKTTAALFADGRTRQEENSAAEQELYEQIGRLKMEVEWLKKIYLAQLRNSDDGLIPHMHSCAARSISLDLALPILRRIDRQLETDACYRRASSGIGRYTGGVGPPIQQIIP